MNAHFAELRLMTKDVLVGDVQLECSTFDENLLTEGTFVDEALVLVVVVSVYLCHRNTFVAQFTFLQALNFRQILKKCQRNGWRSSKRQ